MKDFFKMMRKKGLILLIIVFLIWLIYFLINFFYPHTFDFLRKDNSLPGQSLQQKESIPLRFRIYNLFFRNSFENTFKTKNATSSTSTNNVLEDKNQLYIYGQGTSTMRNKNRLLAKDLYVYPNTRKNAVAQNFRFNGLLATDAGINLLSEGTIITGEISTNYLSSYYFNIDIYDENGDYLYSIPSQGYINPKDENLLIMSAVNKIYYNTYGYKGDGYLVIWSDNTQVESVLISKIKID